MQTNSPLNQYHALVSTNKISFDESQQQVVELIQQLYLALQPNSANEISKSKNSMTKGIYLWGKVGRGKTFLMDLLVSSLSSASLNKRCKRQHFHHFMQEVHQQLNVLSGKSEPLKIIAQQFSEHYQVLCFDEFFVSDIGDAMLLGNLLQFMFELGIVLVSTSNCAPQQLYRNGLQRERFLPAIAAIEQHTQVLELTGEQDHRHRTLTFSQNYFELPKSAEQQVALLQLLYNQLYLEWSDQIKLESLNSITILGRSIYYLAKNSEAGHSTICFDFANLCQGPRSQFDYVEIAKQFRTILLINVPPMSGQAYERIKARGTEDNGSNINVSASETGEREVILAPMDDAARRFIALVDECYDCNLNLMITAYVPQEQLYTSGSLLFEFERTKSRLIEMASMEYLARG